MGIVRGPTSQDDMTRNLPKDTNMNRYNKPVQTPVGGAETPKPAFNRQKQREMTTAAEVGRKLSDLTEPSRYQGSAVEAEGAVTGAIPSAPYLPRLLKQRSSTPEFAAAETPLARRVCKPKLR